MTLTEQLKKGEIKQGEYWCKTTESPYVERVYIPCCDDIIVEVLAEVPTYQEYLESEAHCAVYSDRNKWLKEENAKLKELLKKTRDIIYDYKDYFQSGDVVKAMYILDGVNAIISKSEE